MRKEVKRTVEQMTVAEMRKVAGQYGIKNAKKYKKAELSEMLIEAMEANSTTKGSKKVVYVHKQVRLSKIEKLEKKIKNVIEGKYTEEEMMELETDVLQEAMRILKVNRWYRIYKRQTMVDMLIEAIG